MECEKFAVNISVHGSGDKTMKGNFQKLSCEPLSIDLEQEVKKLNGLMVGSLQLEKIIERTDSKVFLGRVGVTLVIKKI